MEQQKLFYNICNDLWAFAKTLDKDRRSMMGILDYVEKRRHT